ncbi:hypothetical protein L2E69_20720 [Planktothrix agardhii 1806]|uniref:hypothetical protein n=1 Tax=Planktothrix agardhii TaxID=1160 RepID=UPI001F348B80|nr:hypothetical protein [Planktothrix agardhii]MCF3618343.1 hypothetical protein [Planktothrix agardhii 1806]
MRKSRVANINDLPTGNVSITGTATQNQTLTATNTLADADGLGTLNYQWQESADNGVTWTDISGATNNTFALSQAQVGKKVQVKVSYTDLLGTAETVNSSPTSLVANINDLPTGNVSITGTATQNQTLTATNTLFGYSLTLRESNIAAVLLKKSCFKIRFIWFLCNLYLHQ